VSFCIHDDVADVTLIEDVCAAVRMIGHFCSPPLIPEARGQAIGLTIGTVPQRNTPYNSIIGISDMR
jgi:hypothetical protein